MAQMKISFAELQRMNEGKKEYPVTERGLHQLLEGLERQEKDMAAKRKREMQKSLSAIKVVRGSIDDVLDKLKALREGELLPFDAEDAKKEENVAVDVSDWPDSVDAPDEEPAEDEDAN